METLVWGTQIEVITAIFIGLEILMFLFQLASYFYWPGDKNRGWFLLLLFLMLLYNITGGLFPDAKIPVAISVQEMIAYGTGFLMACYFPFYFYKAFGLKTLRWHALYGVPLFLALPYLIFFVIVYAINGNLNVDIRIGMIIPFFYALVLLWVMFKAIRHQYRAKGRQKGYTEEIAMYWAVSPWAALAFFGLVEASQFIEVLCTNMGIVVISILYLRRSVSNAQQEYHKRQTEPAMDLANTEEFMANCLHYGLTRMEILVVRQVYKGKSNKEIAAQHNVSEETVKKHIQNALRKTGAKNRTELLHKLQNRL